MEVHRLTANHLRRLLSAARLFDEPLSESAARAYLEDERNVFFLALEGDRAVGFLRGTSLGQIKSIQRQMFIYEIGVDPAYQRRGIGRALIEAVLRYCRDLGFEEAFVFTDPANKAAVALYQSTGAATETPADRMYVYKLSD